MSYGAGGRRNLHAHPRMAELLIDAVTEVALVVLDPDGRRCCHVNPSIRARRVGEPA